MLQKKYVFQALAELAAIIAEITSSEAYKQASGVLLQLYNPKVSMDDEKIVA